MKKVIALIMFILIVFVSPVSSKILGIEFNEKLPENHGYTKVEGNKNEYYAHKPKNLQVFDSFRMHTDDSGIVDLIEFNKTYKMTYESMMHDPKIFSNKFKNILSSLEKKYGEFDKTDCEYIFTQAGKMGGLYIGDFKETAKLLKVNNEIGLIYISLDALGEFDLENGKEITIRLVYINNTQLQQIKNNVKKDDF